MRDRHNKISEVNFTEFKGLANFLASNRSSIKYAYYGKNCFFDRGKILSSPGHSPFLSSLSGDYNYQCLQKYEYNTGGVATEYLMALFRKQWYKIDTEGAERTAVGSMLSTDEKMDSEQYVNRIYAVSPTNGAIKITDPDTVESVSTMPKGSMIAFAWERSWITGVKDNEATLYGSTAATASALDNVEDFTTDPQTELVGKGGRNTALKLHNNILYIFKRDSVHYIEPKTQATDAGSITLFIPEPLAITAGAVNNDSVTTVENDLWFLTPANEIRTLGQVANYSGSSRASALTDIIRNIKDELAQDQSNVARIHYEDNIVTVALAEKGSSVANIVIKYNYYDGGFSIDRFPSVYDWETVNGKVYMATTNSGQLYQDRFGYSFGENFEIPFEVRMPFVDFQKPYQNYRNRRLFIRVARSKGVEVTVRLYKGNYNTYTDYVLPAPTEAELAESSTSSPIGSDKFGSTPFGGSRVRADDKPEIFIKDFHISTKHISNMFAVGILAELESQRLEVEQITMGLLPASKQKFNL